MFIVHIILIAAIIFSEWAIFKTWSNTYKSFISDRVKRLPNSLRWIYPKDPHNTIIEMRTLSIVCFIFTLVMEIIVIVR
jgi:hypothetical protein